MALIQSKYCNHCEATTIHTNGKCNDCYSSETRESMAAWLAKTTDEKLLDVHKRLLKIEGGAITY